MPRNFNDRRGIFVKLNPRIAEKKRTFWSAISWNKSVEQQSPLRISSKNAQSHAGSGSFPRRFFTENRIFQAGWFPDERIRVSLDFITKKFAFEIAHANACHTQRYETFSNAVLLFLLSLQGKVAPRSFPLVSRNKLDRRIWKFSIVPTIGFSCYERIVSACTLSCSQISCSFIINLCEITKSTGKYTFLDNFA